MSNYDVPNYYSQEGVNRRTFLLKYLGPIAVGLTAVACGSQQEQGPTPAESMLSSIETLPPSLVKNLLLEKVSPLFREPAAQNIQVGDVNVNVLGSTVTRSILDKDDILLRGSIKLRSELKASFFRSYMLYPSENIRIDIPVPGGILSSEPLPTGLKVVDGVTVAAMRLDRNGKYICGISPLINVGHRGKELVSGKDKELLPSLIQMAEVKEASTLLFELLMLEEIERKMKQLGISPYVDGRNEFGLPVSGEVLTTALYSFFGAGGRTLAIADIGGYVLTGLAYKKSPEMNSVLEKIPEWAPGLDEMQNLESKLSDPSQIVEEVSLAILGSNKIQKVIHNGNLNQYP